jgi:flagellar protein FliL
MKKLLLPLILMIVGTGSGVGAALFLFPPVSEAEVAAIGPCGEVPVDDHAVTEPGNETVAEMVAMSEPVEEGHEGEAPVYEYAKLNNQFVVPVVVADEVAAMVILSLSIEVMAGQKDQVFEVEPKLRDVFLQVLFDHANTGGFDGNFTETTTMRSLRGALQRAAEEAVPGLSQDVLIIEIVRQDIVAAE